MHTLETFGSVLRLALSLFAISLTRVSAAAEPVSGVVDGQDVLGVLFGLVVVLGSVVVVGWLYARSRGLQGMAGQAINVVAAQSLGPKERIVLVEVGGKQIVVGMTSAQLQTLHVFDEPVVLSGSDTSVVPTAFAERLRSMLRGVHR